MSRTPSRRPPLLPEGYELGALDSVPHAVGFMLLSAASFAVMGAMVKAAGDVPVHQKVFFRNLVTLILTVVIAVGRRENPFGPTKHLPLLISRSLAGLVGIYLYFYAIDHLNLADAALLNRVSPFFVTIFAVAWLGERLTGRVLAGLVIAFLGAALVIRPALDLEPLPALAGLGSAVGAGLAYTIVRRLKGRERPWRIVFYFSLISTLVTAPPLLLDREMPHGQVWIYLVGTGVFAAGGQVFLTLAYHRAPAAQISIWGYNHVLFSLLIGLLVWGERPDLLTYVGGTLILAAALMNRRTR